MRDLYISMYHYTRDLKHSRYPRIQGLDVSLFDKQIEFLSSTFNVVTMEQVIDAVMNNGELPERALLLTFDDGYADNYTFALPILEKYKVQGSFFIPGKTFAEHKLLNVNKIHYILAAADINELVKDLKKEMDYYRGREFDYAPTDELYQQYAVANRFDCGDIIFVKRILQTALPEKLRDTISSKLFAKYIDVNEEQLAYELYMTEDQVRTMKRHGMHIGIHGYDHYWLANLTKDELQRDISLALDTLDEFVDRKKWVMNYPYGNYSDDVIDYIKDKGAVLGLSTKVNVANLDRDNRYALPRLDCNDYPPKSENYKNY